VWVLICPAPLNTRTRYPTARKITTIFLLLLSILNARMTKLVVLIAALLVLFNHCYCEDERPASLFKAGEEWLALPEVFSNLDFAADSTPASEEDIQGQIRLRSTRFWGRLYIDGWPQTIQFFRAHFGIEPPLGRKTFVFAEPRDACTDLTSAEHLTSDHFLLVHRGTCTFGTKAKFAEKTKASGIIIINNEPGLDHLPGPDAHDIQFSVSSIAQLEGMLLESVYDEGPANGPFGRKLEGYVVPINCENAGARCVPATYEERQNVAKLIEGTLAMLLMLSSVSLYVLNCSLSSSSFYKGQLDLTLLCFTTLSPATPQVAL